MDCSHCGTKVRGIYEMNHIWCSQCGQSLKEQPEFVVGFQNPHYVPRQQIYNRQKRFAKWALNKCAARSDVLKEMRNILNYFSCYEFVWNCHKQISKRIYFFAKPVMLQVCCNHVGVSQKDLPCLKDGTREVDQKIDLKKLFETSSWKTVSISRLSPLWR